MSNDHYTHSGFPATNSTGSSQNMRNELDLITNGFAKLPSFAGNANRQVYVNAGETGLEARAVSPVIASAVTYVPGSGVASTNVQDAVAEVMAAAVAFSIALG